MRDLPCLFRIPHLEKSRLLARERARASIDASAPSSQVIMKNKCHGIECDMWSIGIMTYLLIGGRFPFYADDGGALGHQIKFMAHSYKDEVSELFFP